MERYLWSYTDNNKAQFWSEGTEQCYFSYECKNQYVPNSLINNFERARIALPEKMPCDIFSKYSILASGILDAKKDYYHSRPTYPYHILLFVLDGKLSCETNGKKITCQKGSAISIPSGAILEESVKCPRCRVMWIHIKPNQAWNTALGTNVNFKECINLEDIVAISQIIKKEIYAKQRSIVFLQNSIAVFAELIMREFQIKSESKTHDKLDTLAQEIQKNPDLDWKRLSQAKKFSISGAKLDAIFEEKFSVTFAKFVLKSRMDKTLSLLKEDELTFNEISKKVGYADQSALSKAFKNYYGKSLKNYESIIEY